MKPYPLTNDTLREKIMIKMAPLKLSPGLGTACVLNSTP